MKKKILYVDNNRTFTEGLKRILEEKGYQMSIANDTKEAVELTKTISPRIIFLDMETPPDNGLETYLEIRKINQNVPVVIVTEEWDDLKNLTWEAMTHGAYTCLYKPFEVDEMLELIEIITTEPTLKEYRKIKKIVNVFLLGFLFVSNIQAEEFVGHTGADFLKQSISVRASALGEAVVALSGDVFSASGNPATLAELKKIEIGFMQSKMIMNAKTEFLGLIYPTKMGTLGLNGIFFIPESIPLIDEKGENIGEIRWLDYALTFSYARKISDYLSFGFNLKIVHREESDPIFGKTAGIAYAGDSGILCTPLKNLNFAFALLNWGEKIQMEREKRKDDLPRTTRVGLTYQWRLSEADKLIFSLDLNKMLADEWGKNIGIEYTLEKIIFLRAGYLEKTGNVQGLTYGWGIKIGNYQIDYANVPASEMIGYTRTNKISFLAQF